jgi:hypothetical protein
MSAYNYVKERILKRTILVRTVIAILLAATWVLSGCGGYRNPTTSQTPGQMPRYPAQHRPG